MKIEILKLADIKPYEKNAKVHPAKQISQIARSIREFGFNQPLVLDKDNVIIVGHGRFFAATQLGLEAVPVVRATGLTVQQVAAYRLADNRLNESDWDNKLLIEELKLLDSQGLDITLTGFSKEIFGAAEDDFDAAKEAGKIKKPVTKLMDVWKLGEHRLMCGDATAGIHFDKLMAGEHATMVFTDPPYGVAYQSGAARGDKSKHAKIKNDELVGDALVLFLTESFRNLFNHSLPLACFYIWHATSTQDEFKLAMASVGIEAHQVIIWLKSHFSLTRADYQHLYEPCFYGWKKGQKHFTNKNLRSWSNVLMLEKSDFEEMLDVWYISRDNLMKYQHPTQKPVRLAERAILKSSNPGDIVLDCFGGSGSTLVACEQLGRTCRMMELDPVYCDVIIKRWEQLTGGKAELL